MSPRDQGLTVDVQDGRLVISIGVDALAVAVAAGDDWEDDWKVTDPDVFAMSIARNLEHEEEDGTTPLHLVFDKAAMDAIEDGEDGVHLPGDDD